ncbi:MULTISPECIES: cell division protein FtsL [Vitreoscilla]|uniref:Cell division protein FtsL n=1 Tax=Vitreoscilla stercoraria TaxID=61 RepID=A0ABY4EAG7_VITST|nr:MULTISPECIES: cell division protein FtsL [Vitreoscilla]AUZ05873.1 cell division protein FtsL [Vitreoscilla sp. C1]UOO92754.1 cell division protein FtsL [Vitreoscilla stercoraria]
MNKLNVLLLVLVVASAFALVTLHYENRVVFIALIQAQQDGHRLEEEHAVLILEQAKFGNHHVIQAAATKQKLHVPSLAETKMIEKE